jgi:hypothetical protein
VDRKIHSSTDLYLQNENQILIKKIANLKSIYMKVCFCLIKFTKEGLKGKVIFITQVGRGRFT